MDKEAPTVSPDLMTSTIWLSPKNHEWVMESLETICRSMFTKGITNTELIDVVVDPKLPDEIVYVADDVGRVHKILIDDTEGMDG
jgi:hypothetical protein